MVDAVSVDGVSVEFGKDFDALKDININIAKGKITGFIGPSGAGKTTLIRSIVGRQKISKGRIDVLGYAAGSAKLRNQISYMTQETSVYTDLTVEQNIDYFATMFGISKKYKKEAINEVLEMVDLLPQTSQMVRNLSTGQKQRVSLAIALVGHPKLMVLDEPTVGLDPILREELWRIFRKLNKQGTTIIISSHVMDEASRCDDLVLIRYGEILASGTPSALCDRTNSRSIEESFLKLVKE